MILFIKTKDLWNSQSGLSNEYRIKKTNQCFLHPSIMAGATSFRWKDKESKPNNLLHIIYKITYINQPKIKTLLKKWSENRKSKRRRILFGR